MERPLHLGAAIAGADDTTIAALRRYGTDLGIAFQLRDDMVRRLGVRRAARLTAALRAHGLLGGALSGLSPFRTPSPGRDA